MISVLFEGSKREDLDSLDFDDTCLTLVVLEDEDVEEEETVLPLTTVEVAETITVSATEEQ